MVQTVVKEEYGPELIVVNVDPLADEPSGTTFFIFGQTTDRSYEDRDVYFEFPEKGWLRGEDAITIGQALIAHGTKALMANMINHQAVHRRHQFEEFIREGRIDKVIMTVVDEHPANYGSGFKTFLVKPTWHEGKAPEYEPEFEFEVVVYWSPFEDSFKEQIEYWGGDKVQLVGYDREKEVADFNTMLNIMEVNCGGGD